MKNIVNLSANFLKNKTIFVGWILMSTSSQTKANQFQKYQYLIDKKSLFMKYKKYIQKFKKKFNSNVNFEQFNKILNIFVGHLFEKKIL